MKKILLLALCLVVLSSCAPALTAVEQHAAGGKINPETLDRLEDFVEDNGGIFEATDGNIISLYTWHEEEDYLDNLSVITRFAEKCSLPVYAAIPPRKMDALVSSLPDTFPFEHSERLFSLAKNELENSSAHYVDLFSALKGKSEFAGHLYFKTDHHWTHEGAFLAYEEIVKKMGKTPLDYESFEKTELLSVFRGSDFTKKNDSLSSDVLTGAYPSGEWKLEQVSYPEDSGENTVISGFFDYPELKTNEPYAVYLGGNVPYVRITKEGEPRETLLVVRDSFASALAPFLACHFDLVLIDPRFFPTGLEQVAEKENASAVLIVENMGSMTEHKVKFMW